MTHSIQEAVLLGDRILVLSSGPGRVRQIVSNPTLRRGGQNFGLSQGGVGWFIYQDRFEMNTDVVFAGLLTVILTGLLVENLLFRWIERRTCCAGDVGHALSATGARQRRRRKRRASRAA